MVVIHPASTEPASAWREKEMALINSELKRLGYQATNERESKLKMQPAGEAKTPSFTHSAGSND